MGGVMPDTRSIPMAGTRGAHWQAHARPQSARQARQSSHAKQSGRTQFNAPSTVERALDAEPNRAAKPVRAADSVRAEQAHRGKQSSRSTQSPAGASSQAEQARQYTHRGRRSAPLPLRGVTSNMNGNAHLQGNRTQDRGGESPDDDAETGVRDQELVSES
mgnify:CR=1 FL=1